MCVHNQGLRNKWKVKRNTTAAACPKYEKPVQTNHKRLECLKCFDCIYVCCANMNSWYIKNTRASNPRTWICAKCVFSELPFNNIKELENLDLNDNLNEMSVPSPGLHLDALNERSKLSFIHVKTHVMTSTFNKLLLVITRKNYVFTLELRF